MLQVLKKRRNKQKRNLEYLIVDEFFLFLAMCTTLAARVKQKEKNVGI
jgi:hypothetical protein